MRRALFILFAIVVGGVAGSIIKNLPGFVIIAYEKTSYEMRLWVACCFLILTFVLLYFLIAVVKTILGSTGRFRIWSSTLGFKRARKKTIAGMMAYTEGRWKDSEDAMVAAAKNSDTKLINYLIAAQAAQHQNAEVRRDAYLRAANKAEPAAKTAIRLTQAQLQLQHNQNEQALATLNELKEDNPNHPYVLKLLGRLYEKLQDWQNMIDLIPAIKKQQVYMGDELQAFERRGIAGLLKFHANKGNIEQLRDCWLNLPSQYRKAKVNILTYAEFLIEFGEMDEAETLMRPIIKKQVDAQSMNLYGNIKSTDAAKQLAFLEAWHKSQTNAPVESFLTLGKLAYNANLWGKARYFLERSLQAEPTAEAYLFMARTVEKLDDIDHATDCYRLGLEHAAAPSSEAEQLTLANGSDDLVSADMLPKFQKLESKN